MLPDCKIRNFTSDWNSGIALAALLDYCRPGLFPDWQRLRPENGNLGSNKCSFILLFLNISFADEVNKLLGVKPSRLSVQTTSCLSCWNNIYIFASNAFPHLAQTHQPPHKHRKKPDRIVFTCHARPGKHQTSDGHCREGVQNTTGGQIYKNIVIIVIIMISIIAFTIHFQTCILNVPRYLSLNILPPHIWTSSVG